MFQAIHALDVRTSMYVVQHRFPTRIHNVLRWYTRLGDGYVWALVVAYLFWNYPFFAFLHIVERGCFAGALSFMLYLVIKKSTRRKRPFEAIDQITAEVPPLDVFSFPSGHTMNNLAAGLTIAILTPEIGWLVVFMPITWGVLRIYFGVHWLSDVIAGVALGVFCYAVAAEVWLHLLTNTFGIV